MADGLRFDLAGLIGSVFVRALFGTTRLERTGEDAVNGLRAAGQPVIFVFWHGQLLPLLYAHRHRKIVTLVSEHRDGEYVARVLRRNGFGIVRGSSTRGGTKSLRGLVRAARSGHDLAVTPDGPQGPAGVFKASGLAAARLTGHPVVPVAAGADDAWHTKSWDRFMVPKPFTRVRVAYGSAVSVVRESSELELEHTARALSAELNRLSAQVGSIGISGAPA